MISREGLVVESQLLKLMFIFRGFSPPNFCINLAVQSALSLPSIFSMALL